MNTLLQFGRTPTHTLQTIGDQALRTSRRRYSSGFPHYQGGVISKLGFNNARHSRVVGDNAARLARFVGLSPSDKP